MFSVVEEACSLSELFFYSTVLPSSFCNNGKKRIYKLRKNTPTVKCKAGYRLRGGSCIKECGLTKNSGNDNFNNTKKMRTTLEVYTNVSITNTTEEGGAETKKTGLDVTTDVNSTEIDKTDINGTKTSTEIGTDFGKTDVNVTNTTADAIGNEECNAGCYGDLCQFNCLCENNATCDKMTGQCTCSKGWTGVYCQDECPRGTYGANCSQTCRCDVTSCHPVDGCICRSVGQNCYTVCPPLTFGSDCSGKCLCLEIATQDCGVLDGSCTCKPGWTGTFCNQLCPVGSFGDGCQQTCECKSNEYCTPTTGTCLCWDIVNGLICTEENSTTTAVPINAGHPATFPVNALHIGILVGGCLLILIAIVCTVVAWRRNRSYGMDQYDFSSKDSTLKIVHADEQQREDLTRNQEEPEAVRKMSCKSLKKSRKGIKPLDVLNLPSRIKSKPPTAIIGFQQYSPTESLNFDELSRHSYVNLKDEEISRHVKEDSEDYERLNKDEINPPLQDYEVCVKTKGPYENVPAKKRSILGSLRKLVRKESHPEGDKAHLADDTGTGINRTSFVTFNKQYT
ncbi:delta-like protein D isoform X2 [Ylistrum balloti]|nr:delta-like protein D isoform X2 [Ylistrum balloti]